MIASQSLTYPQFICIGPAKFATTWLTDQFKPQYDMWFPLIHDFSYMFLSFEHLQASGHPEYHNAPWSIFKRVVRNKSLPGRFYALAKTLTAMNPYVNGLAGCEKGFRLAEGKFSGEISPIYALFTSRQVVTLAVETGCLIDFILVRDPVSHFVSCNRMMKNYRKFGDADYGSAHTVVRFLHNLVQSPHVYPSQIYKRCSMVWDDRFSLFDFDDVTADLKATLNRITKHIASYKRQSAFRSSVGQPKQCT